MSSSRGREGKGGDGERDPAADLPLPAAKDEPRLVAFWDGGSLMRMLPPSGTLTIGRSASSDVCIDHASVSVEHAIFYLDDEVRIEDVGSERGTRVAGRAVVTGQTIVVVPGEVIELGQVAVVIERGRAAAVTANAFAADAFAGARLRQDLAAFERQRIVEALATCAGNQTKAARVLGISRRTLVSRLGQYDLPRPRRDKKRT